MLLTTRIKSGPIVNALFPRSTADEPGMVVGDGGDEKQECRQERRDGTVEALGGEMSITGHVGQPRHLRIQPDDSGQLRIEMP